MFTGLIESLGRIAVLQPAASGVRVRVTTELAPELTPGDSLAVNGVCLTVVDPDGDSVGADVSPETIRVTTLGGLAVGAAVNLERPLRADARLGGHFVQASVGDSGRPRVSVPY